MPPESVTPSYILCFHGYLFSREAAKRMEASARAGFTAAVDHHPEAGT